MIKLRKRKDASPELMLSPMLDMIFLLLVFFILSTMYMTEVRTVPVRLPVASQSVVQNKAKFNITIKKDNSLWLDEVKVSKEKLLAAAKAEARKHKDFVVIIRGAGDTEYKNIISLLDAFKKEGIAKVGLATDKGVN